MQHEIEAKFLDLDHNEIRAKLETLGADLVQPMQLMRRTLFDYEDKRLHAANGGRLRIRDEGNKVTMTFKSGRDDSYSLEAETTVGSYDDAAEIIEAIGLKSFTTQETKRETWHYQDVEIMLDEWPWLNPFIEIEGKSEEEVRKIAGLLGLDWANACFGSSDTVYRRQYKGMSATDTIGAVEQLSFSGELPVWLEERKN
jgi:adenylate cyclase class 2